MAVNLDSAIDKVVIFLVIVALVPGALVSYFNVSTTGWDADLIRFSWLKHNHNSHLGNPGNTVHNWNV